jgi:uncharacterized protein (DUF2062 family)/SAM-dependent methyltransferase
MRMTAPRLMPTEPRDGEAGPADQPTQRSDDLGSVRGMRRVLERLREWVRGPRAWVHKLWAHLMSQHTSTLRLAAAVGVGLFIGNLPFYGFHFFICVGVAWALRLNQPTTYLAANISNPLVAPFLIFGAIQIGQRLLVGRWLPLSLAELHARGGATFFKSWLLGSVVLGGTLGFVGSGITYAAVDFWRVHRSPLEPVFRWVEGRYADAAVRRFVSSKLRRDPVFRNLPEHLPAEGAVVDLGSGRGQLALMLAKLAPGRAVTSIDWDERKVDAARAAAAGAPDAAGLAFVRGDARSAELPRARCVVLLDLLHYFPVAEQDAILARAAAALEPGGRLLVREADAAGGVRFAITRFFERLAVGSGVTRGEGLVFRPAGEIAAALERLGLAVKVLPMSMGTPLANVLFVADRS